MKTNATIATRKNGLEAIVMNFVQQPLERLSDYYSKILERQLSLRQTWLLINAQVAFLFTVFPACSLLMRALCIVWLVSALLRCKAELEA